MTQKLDADQLAQLVTGVSDKLKDTVTQQVSQSLHEREPKTVLAIVKELDREHVARLDVGVIKLVGALIQKASPGAGAQWVRRGLTGLGARGLLPVAASTRTRSFGCDDTARAARAASST